VAQRAKSRLKAVRKPTALKAAPEAKSQPGGSRKLKIALLGFGTVGSAVAKLITQDPRSPFVLTHVFNRDVKRKKVDWLPDVHWTQNVDDVLDSDVEIVVELVGGVTPPGDWVRKALRAGKSVVTANKLLIAESGPELLKLAAAGGQRIEFGASVAGGIPAIIAIQEGLMADRLHKVQGILNGTCNYILTSMEAKGTAFADALAQAQKLGFAEADPRGHRRIRRARQAGHPDAGWPSPAGAQRAGSVPADLHNRGGRFHLRARTQLHHPPNFAG
jgi:homoserine dehydrogenase